VNIHGQEHSFECAAVRADAKANRVARELKVFLEKTRRHRVRCSRRRRPTTSFAKVLAPSVSFAVTRLRRTASSGAKKIVANSAWDDLRQHLLERLAFVLAPTLHFQQNLATAVARSLETGRQKRNLPPEITLLETIIEFPDLLETTSRLISAWIDAQHELFARLWRDKATLSSAFLRGRQRFRVTGIRPGLSDAHEHGRTATMIEFAGDRRVIYKPRPCDREQLWFKALRWLGQNGLGVSFRAPQVLVRKRYAWMEFLRNKSCENPALIRLFYFRWGAQAALAQILAAADLHLENWLAVGSHPILVDAELIGDAKPPSRRRVKDRQSLPALLQTGLLPLRERDRAGFYRGIAPFDATISKTASATCWPRYRRAVQRPSMYVSDLVRGFDAAAGILTTPEMMQKFVREIILPTPWNETGRVLLRASAQYARLLRNSFEARNMISAGERWRRLVRECCESAPSRRIGLEEARSLLRCDIPKFARRRGAVSVLRKGSSNALAELKDSSRLLRRRVLLGTRARNS
jgi:lantibiotic modifying enzyme